MQNNSHRIIIRETVAAALARKVGIKEGMRAIFVNAPSEVVESIKQDTIIAKKLTGNFDYIHFFAKSIKEFKITLSKLKKHLKQTGMLWVSWPKSGQLSTDLTLKKIIELGYDSGMVESKSISVNSVWSAIKFTIPKKGKEYHNSYGKLRRNKTS